MSTCEQLFSEAIRFHQQEDFEQARRLYEEALAIDAAFSAAAINLGVVYRRLNLIDKAVACYKQATTHAPDSLEAWFNFGNLTVALKDWQQAAECYQRILKIQPSHEQALYQLSVIAREQGLWQECADKLDALLKISPKHAGALVEMGNAQQHLGERKKALSFYRRLVKHHPRSWQGHYSLARWYDGEVKKTFFSKHLKSALKTAPSAWFIYHSLAQARFDMGSYSGALEMYQLAIKDDSSQLNSLIGLGACYIHLGNEAKATACFSKVSESEDVSLLSELARIIWEYKFFEEGITILKKIVYLRPDLADTHLNLAKAYVQNWNMSLARKNLEKTLSIKPGHTEAEDLLASISVKQGLSDDAVNLYLGQIKREGPLSTAVSSYLFSYLYSDKATAFDKAEAHKAQMKNWQEAYQQPVLFKQNKDAGRVVRVGFVSADFRDQHPVGIFVESVFKHYDHDKIHVSAYYNSRTYDDSTTRLKALVDDWSDVANWTDERLKAKIMHDEIDILVDLSGHTAKHRLRMFAMRAAPVQLTWMGYPHSTGLAAMDYMVADGVVCPPENDGLCSEKVIRLENHCVFCLPPTDKFGEVNVIKPASRKRIVFGSFNNLTKVNETTLSLWLAVIKAVPDSILKLKTPSFTDAECCNEFKQYFIKAGISEDRLVFTGPSSLEHMMQEYAEVDIALDTFPYNGGTTSFQALWMGVPVLAMAGDNFCGRMGASIMSHLGLPEWVASDKDDYIQRACQFAKDRQALLALKKGLRQQMIGSPLCDTKGFAGDMCRIFGNVWSDYCQENVE